MYQKPCLFLVSIKMTSNLVRYFTDRAEEAESTSGRVIERSDTKPPRDYLLSKVVTVVGELRVVKIFPLLERSHSCEKVCITSSGPSICPHVSSPRSVDGFPLIWYCRVSGKSVERSQIWLKWYKNIGDSTCRLKCFAYCWHWHM